MCEETLDKDMFQDITRLIIETDEEKPTVICTITTHKINIKEGYRVRLKPKYDD